MEGKDDMFEIVLLVHENNEGSQDNSWYLDTSENNNMYGKRSMFVELDE